MRMILIVVAVLILLVSPDSWSQSSASPGPDATASSDHPAHQRAKRIRTPAMRITAQMERDLALSAEQTAKVEDINQKGIDSLQAVSPTEEEIKRSRRQQREILAERDRALKAVLSEKQYADYAAKKDKYEKRMRNTHPADAR